MVVMPIGDDDDVDLNTAPPVNLNREEWEIKKILKRSDIDGSSRLLLGKQLVREYILPHVPGIDISEAEGIEIAVWELDTRTEHVLVLKQWSTGSFVMTKNWMSGFVKRRRLKENDEIGLRWDDENSRLEFTILNGHRNQSVRRS
ncbi:hypothetical protein CDL12_24733 [Handroanthus impetiginosus]|uniref:TF-B3 domain-containing protein n=1 Tax=Handroanthus impetiginosus TaxID=429701 RepID=A0A2G9GBT1_9LAMI|nr:hypothetical protein CDL12_24733 [Handroanthus impetiginosus]